VAICLGFNLVALFFFLPETQYRREEPASLGGLPCGKPAESISTFVAPILPSKKSYIRELIPWSGINPGNPRETKLINLFLRPWPLIFYPANIYSFVTFSVVVGCIIGISNMAGPIFQAPPYNFSPGIQGLGVYLPALIGCTIGAICGGLFTDIYTRFRTRQNGGVFEPEGRLVALIVPFFIVPAGVLMFSKCKPR
jgi:hypothetical protein